MAKFSWTGHISDHRDQNDKEDREALLKHGLDTSIKHEVDGTIKYTISGDEDTVSKWGRIIGGS
ncbi:hypothetical protein [Streptomyces sp. KL116D]|uniref:hypothetical protein n=1 Tax=Streptomyces sp. KL116D TaxID=3045152 RepID=UPI003558FCA0